MVTTSWCMGRTANSVPFGLSLCHSRRESASVFAGPAHSVILSRTQAADGFIPGSAEEMDLNITDKVKESLQRRARRRSLSMEEEVRNILRNALTEEEHPGGLGTEIASLFVGAGLKSDIPELNGREVKPISFDA